MVLEAIFNQLYFSGLFPQCCSWHTVLLNVTNHPETSRIIQCRLFILPSPGFSFLALEFGNNPKGNREVCEPSLKYASWLAPFPVFLASPGTCNQCNSCSPCAVVYRPPQLLTFQPKKEFEKAVLKTRLFLHFSKPSYFTLLRNEATGDCLQLSLICKARCYKSNVVACLVLLLTGSTSPPKQNSRKRITITRGYCT